MTMIRELPMGTRISELSINNKVNQQEANMAYFPSGKGFYQPKTNYQPNLDAGLLARIRGEVQRKEQEQKKKANERLEQNTKRIHLVTQIKLIVKTLPIDFRNKFTFDIVNSLALSLLDGTVFEIVRGLEDIQQLSERNLLTKRMKLINSQKAERMKQNKLHKAAVDSCSSKPHNLPLVKKRNAQEKQNLESRLEQELVQMDQKLVLELDRVVADQQTTMQRAGVPLFHITNDSQEIQLQMHILDIVTKLSSS